MLISEGYRELNRELHKRTAYGSHGCKWANAVLEIIEDCDIQTLLDYGCGKGTLKVALGELTQLEVCEYDPAIEGKSARPAPAELVVCTDVLEHIEPDLLDNVVADLKGLATRYLLLVVSTRPATKFLADGRNAHLIIQSAEDWLPKLTKGWDTIECREEVGELVLLLRSRVNRSLFRNLRENLRRFKRGKVRLAVQEAEAGNSHG